MKQRPTPFQKALREVFTTRGTFTRKEWAQLLRVKPDVLEGWLTRLTIPSPENLKTIFRTTAADHRWDKARARFEKVLDLPAHEAMGYSVPYVARTLRHYMVKPLMDGFLRSLNTLPPQQQESVLYAASALCRGTATTY